MKRHLVVSLFLILLLLVPSFCHSAELDEEELYFEDWVEETDEDNGLAIVETDGSKTITITCTSDLTIGKSFMTN